MNEASFRKMSGSDRVVTHIVLIVIFLLLTFFPKPFEAVRTVEAHGDDGHSHVRFAHITWISVDTDPVNSARFTFTAGFRRNAYSTCSNPLTGASVACTGPSGFPGVGDMIREDVGGTTIDDFGDGTSIPTTLYFKVFSINVTDNWLMARALHPGTNNQEYIFHDFPDTNLGPYTVVSESCCRTGFLVPPNAHINNPDKSYRFATVVDFNIFGTKRNKASPISLLPPIVDCPLGTEKSWSSNPP